MTFLETIRQSENLPPKPKRQHRGESKPASFKPLFLSVIERNGFYILTDLNEFKSTLIAVGKTINSFLDENKLELCECKGGYKLSRKKDLAV